LSNPTIQLNGNKVLPDFNQPQPGKGSEFMTLDVVGVKIINWLKLK
jgi:hypothetical protein